MIISHKLRFVYIGPPKTASTALHCWLSQPLLCGNRFQQFGSKQHRAEIPESCESYFTFASTRDPVNWLISMWRHANREDAGNVPIEAKESLAEFLRWRKTSDASWFYRQDQADYLQGIRLDAVVRVESLVVDLEKLPFVHPIRHKLEPLPVVNTTGVDYRPTPAELELLHGTVSPI